MKNMFICLKISKIYFSIIILILIILGCFIGKKWCYSIKKIEMNNAITLIENSENGNEIPFIQNSKNDNMDEITQEKTPKLEEYKTMPREIRGHNYNNFFAKIKNLKIKDNIILTDTYDHSAIYEVYDTFQTSPQDISCLNQDTKCEKELTLITCTKGATKRIIVKAVEVYD